MSDSKRQQGPGMADDEKSAPQAVEIAEINWMAESKLVRRLDLHLIPIVMLLYLLSFLDRYIPIPTEYHDGDSG